MKEQFKGKRFKQGSYSSVLIVIVIAIVVVINMVASQLPAQFAKLDITENKLYSIGDQTKQMLAGLDTDINIYLICQEGNEDDTIMQMLDRYKGASSHVHVSQKDPVVSPGFTKQYTDETVSDNSIIVVSGDTYKYIPYSDLYVSEIDYNSYSYKTTGYDGEGQLTSAIAYVTSDDLPKMYILQGHNEQSVSSSLTTRISKENITTETLSLLTMDSVPEDCDILLINAPQNDLSEDEATKIINYLDNGGKVFMVSNYTGTEMPNYDKVLAHYGLSRVDGIVLEGNPNNYYPSMPYYLIPDLDSHTITSPLKSANRFVILPSAQGIQISDAPRDGVTVSQLIGTSDSAYSKVNVADVQTLEKEDGDIDGPFALAVAVSEEIAGGGSGDEAAGETSGESGGEAAGETIGESGDQATGETSGESGDQAAGETSGETAGETGGEVADESTGESSGESSDEVASETSGETAGETGGEVDSETMGETNGSESNSESEETKKAQLVYVTTAGLLDDTMDGAVSGGNYDFFMNAISWMSGEDSSVSIEAKSLSYDYLVTTAGSANTWGIILIAVVPVAVLITGVVIWVRRRKR